MAIYSLLNQSEQNTNADFSRMQTNFISGAGVVDLDGGDCEVTENGTPNLSVNVAAGSGYILNDSWTQNSGLVQFVEYENTATENVAINSNSSGNPRITSIFAKFDASANPGTRSDGSVSFVAIDGTASATPSAPAVPSDGNSYDLLAHVTVSNGASSITNSDISDERTRMSFSLGNTAEVDEILDEDNMASDSATALATQQSIKAYADTLQNAFRAYLSSNQATTGTSVEDIQFDTEDFDNGSNFNTGTYTYTVPEDGVYLFVVQGTLTNTSDTDGASIVILLNGSTELAETKIYGVSNSSDPSGLTQYFGELSQNDTIKCQVQSEGSGGETLVGASKFTFFHGFKVGKL